MKTLFGMKLVVPALLLILVTGCMDRRIIRASDRQEVKFPELIEGMRGARLILVGELHDTKWHHRAQLDIIRALDASGVPVAIGLEMFRAEDQDYLDRWVSGSMDEEEFIKVYYRNWHIPWGQYSPIFRFAREKRVPMVGLNVSKKIIHQVFVSGYASLTAEQKKEIPRVTCNVDPEYEQFIREAMSEHDKGKDSFRNFCEAQMLWDSAMAAASVKFLEEHPERTMVVLAGGGHSWKRGIPRQVRERSNIPYLVVLPEMPDMISPENASVRDADYVWADP